MTAAIKFLCAGLLATMMAFSSPVVLRLFWYPFVPSIQTSVPERLATAEGRLSSLEHRMDSVEGAKVGERLSAIEARQSIVLLFLAPMAVFVFTHSWETWQRLRGNRRTRQDDYQHKSKQPGSSGQSPTPLPSAGSPTAVPGSWLFLTASQPQTSGTSR